MTLYLTLKNQSKSAFCLIALGLFFSACGPAMRPQGAALKADQAVAPTGGSNLGGKEYTFLNLSPAVQQIQNSIKKTPETIAFSQKILNVDFKWSNKTLTIVITWLDQIETETFVGTNTNISTKETTSFKLNSKKSSSSLYLEAQCDNNQCDNISVFVKSKTDQKTLTGILLQKESRILTVKASRFVNQDRLSSKGQDFYRDYQQGKEVEVRSFSVLNGASKYKVLNISDKENEAPEVILEGELVSPDGDKVPVINSNSTLQSMGSTYNVGQDDQGSLLLLQEDKGNASIETEGSNSQNNKPQDKQKLAIEIAAPVKIKQKEQTKEKNKEKPLDTSNTPQAKTMQENPCDVDVSSVSSPQVKSILTEYIGYCDQKEVQKVRNEILKNLTSNIYRALDLHHGALSEGPRPDIYTQFRSMLEKVSEAELPWVLAASLTSVESAFKRTAFGSKGELGVWQIMPATGREYGLKVTGKVATDERADVAKSSVAMSKFLNDLLQKWSRQDPVTGEWKTNTPMVLASYNMGANGAQKASDHAENCIQGNKDSRCLSNKYKPLTADDLAALSEDFFVITKFTKKISNGTKEYVPKILAIGQLLLNPEKLGVSVNASSKMKQNYPYLSKAEDISLLAN